jgi:Peptidase family M28/PA domain
MKTSLVGYLQKVSAFVLVGAVLTLQTFAQATAPAPSKLSEVENDIAAKLSVETIKEVTTVLSADDMQGRGALQPGGDKAANYIAERFSKLGLKPLGDKGSFLQKVEFKETVVTPETMFKVDDESLNFGTDYAFIPMNNGNKDISGDLVFVGYGIVASSIKRNDLEGINVNGKIVVMLEGPPSGIPKEAWEKQKASMVFTQNLMQKGAAGIIFVEKNKEDHAPDEAINYLSRRQITMPNAEGYPAFVPPLLYVSSKGLEKLFTKSDVNLKDALAQAETNGFKAVKLNRKAKIVAKYKTTKGTSSNVVGFIEGSDPKLKEEAVLFSAHYDAYGLENGKNYHGAADNALGVAEMTAVAEVFSKMKPKRSLIFLAVTGEEYGLFGSKYWSKNPTWNIKKVSGNLNLDGVGTEVYASVKTMVGYGAEHSTLGAMLKDVATSMDLNVIPDPFPDEKIFYRSDHYSFVERGVPSLMLLGAPAGEKELWIKRMKDWEKTDYHQPSDTIKLDWAWDGAKTVSVVMAIIGNRLADADSMPYWLPLGRFGKLERGNDKPLPEEK